MDYLKRWGIVIDTGKDELYIRMARKTFKIDSSQSNHWKLPIQNGRTLHKQAHRLVLSVELCDLNDRDLRKHILKTHKNLAHKSEGHMTRLFRMAGKASTRTRKIIKDVCDKCNICNLFRKTRPRPTVAMAKANTPNEVVSLDLKEMREHKCHILYCVDEFSGYIKAAVIKNKEPETVLKALTRIWVREGPGHPSKGWFSDNVGEFRNAIMMEAAAKLGLRIFLTAGNSPWPNGKNERNHYSCDMTISKLLADDKKLTLTEALSHAIYAHNLQITKKGFSPIQLTFGRQGIIPGITHGNPASLEPVVESDWFRQELANRQKTEELFRKIDSNERLQKLMAQKITGAADAVYHPGDEVVFKENDKSRWSGPAQVTGVLGSKIRLIFGGYERTVSAIDVAHFKEEVTVIETEEPSDNADPETEDIQNQDALDWRQNKDLPAGRQTRTSDDVSEANLNWEKDKELPDGWMIKDNNTVRPKLYDNIKFSVGGCLKTGKVVKVGKSTGRDKFRCWVKKGDTEENFDFLNEVEHWKVVDKNVLFQNIPKDSKCSKMRDHEDVGVLHLKSWHNIQEMEELVISSQGMDAQKVYATEVSRKFHDHPDIIAAKQEELKRWKEYDTVSQVSQTEDMQVL